MDQETGFDALLNAFKEDLVQYYEDDLLPGFTTKDYERVKVCAIPATLQKYPILQHRYGKWNRLQRKHGSEALTLKAGDTDLEQGHRIWAATGRVGRDMIARASDAKPRSSKNDVSMKGIADETTEPHLPNGVYSKPYVARRIVREAAKHGAFIPDPEILQQFSRIAQSDWEDAILALVGFDFETVEHGIVLKEIKPDPRQTALKKLEAEFSVLRSRIYNLYKELDDESKM